MVNEWSFLVDKFNITESDSFTSVSKPSYTVVALNGITEGLKRMVNYESHGAGRRSVVKSSHSSLVLDN